MELEIAVAGRGDAGEIMTVQRAAFVIEGELNGSFRLPPMTETLDEIRAAIGADDTVVLVARLGHRIVGTSESNLRLHRSLGYVDIGWRPAAAEPGLAYLEKRV
jgi:hypothetical protein